MKYWYDTEFAEDGVEIDLISIGIVAEDGREYYAQSAEFLEYGHPNTWVQRHVIPFLGNKWRERGAIRDDILAFMDLKQYGKPELWAYFAAYDHVAFCQLFGTMMDLPKGFPMLTLDLKQWCQDLGNPQLPEQQEGWHNALTDARWNRDSYFFLENVQQSHFLR